MEKHTILGGKVHVYKRENSDKWQCSAYMNGKNRRASTKETSLAKAKSFAEDWYLEMRGKSKAGELHNEKKFRQAADQFMREYEVITEGERSPLYVAAHQRRLKLYLVPFFGNKPLSAITAGMVQEYRIYRQNYSAQRYRHPEDKKYGAPARSTIHQEIVVLRQVLKTAIRHGWLQHLPDLSVPYKANSKISHRAWFTREEYKRLYEATRRRAQKPSRKNYKWSSEQLHDFVLFMANSGLRPDEAYRLEFRDVEIVEDETTEETILVIHVRGKRGVGICKTTNGAVRPFERLVERNGGAPTDLIFPKRHKVLFNQILDEENLKFDREGRRRTAYSLRHTYICFRLMEGADIYQIAKNCRTSVEMIEKYYAAHLTNMIDASAINVRRK